MPTPLAYLPTFPPLLPFQPYPSSNPLLSSLPPPLTRIPPSLGLPSVTSLFLEPCPPQTTHLLIPSSHTRSPPNLLPSPHRTPSYTLSLSQDDRDSTISDFKSGNISLLVATSVAARGLDVKDLVCVINYEVPNHYEDYVHRVGRTGRAGNQATRPVPLVT